MAEALCGPSNPLQNIQKHASVDRTLQQDRLAFRQSPHQGFRSTGPVSGTLDAEFEAFQAGPSLSGGLPQNNHPFHHARLASFTGPSQQQLPSWASDFQNLNLNDSRSSPIPPSQFRHEAPLQRATPGTWQQDWQGQRSSINSNESRTMAPTTRLGSIQYPYGGLGTVPQGALPMSNHSFGTNPLLSSEQKFLDDEIMQERASVEAFERAFEAVGEDLKEAVSASKTRAKPTTDTRHERDRDRDQDFADQLAAVPKEIAVDEETLDFDRNIGRDSDLGLFDFDAFLRSRDEFAMEDFDVHNSLHFENQDVLDHFDFDSVSRPIYDSDVALNAPFIRPRNSPSGPLQEVAQADDADRLTRDTAQPFGEVAHEQREEPAHDNDADELARTAGLLLDKVQHEQGEKFQNSKFLALMRQLRDKEMRVDGDQMVDNSQPLHPGGENYPGGLSDTTKQATMTDDPGE